MDPLEHDQLAESLDRHLRKLPSLKAPPSLMPAVLRAIRQRGALPWWRRSWQGWPPALQVAFLLTGLLVVAGLLYGATVLPGEVLAAVQARWANLWEPLAQIANTVIAMLAGGGLKLWALLLVVGAVAYAACISLATFGYRLALNRI